MYLGAGIEIYLTLFVAFTRNNTLAVLKVYVFFVEFDEFAYTHTC